MSIDVEQFHSVFFDESEEHLQAMEDLLMTIDVDAPDMEELNSIFRAAHSIKGGSGIFGFDQLTGLTHIMETLLDKARNQAIQLNSAIVDLFLETVDILKATLNAYREQQPLPEAEIAAGISQLEATLSALDAAPPAFDKLEDEDCEEDAGFAFFDD